jgi:hypothetical protein
MLIARCPVLTLIWGRRGLLFRLLGCLIDLGVGYTLDLASPVGFFSLEIY